MRPVSARPAVPALAQLFSGYCLMLFGGGITPNLVLWHVLHLIL